MTHTFQHIYSRFGSLDFCAPIYITCRSLSNQQAVGGSGDVQSLHPHFWNGSLYTPTQVSHSRLRCYTRGKIADISTNRVTFAYCNEMAVDEISGSRSSQTSYNPSKLNIWFRNRMMPTNLRIGFEYKHISVVCHEWCQTLHLILFSHDSITCQRPSI